MVPFRSSHLNHLADHCRPAYRHHGSELAICHWARIRVCRLWLNDSNGGCFSATCHSCCIWSLHYLCSPSCCHRGSLCAILCQPCYTPPDMVMHFLHWPCRARCFDTTRHKPVLIFSHRYRYYIKPQLISRCRCPPFGLGIQNWNRTKISLRNALQQIPTFQRSIDRKRHNMVSKPSKTKVEAQRLLVVMPSSLPRISSIV